MKCNCIRDTDIKLKEQGLELSPKLLALVREGKSARVAYFWPVERLDRSRLKKCDVKGINMEYCPFCGERTHEQKT